MPRNSPQAATVEAPPPVGLVTVDGKTFPLKEATLTGRAEGGLAVSRLVQTYANPFDEPLEAIYTLALPADGAVIGYSIHVGERVIHGVIEAREKARADYQRALEAGRLAGLLEQERADTFTQSLGNLAPGENARVEVEVLHPLAFVPAGPRWEYRFPTVVSVRYEGAPGRVPDAEQLDVNRGTDGTPVRLSLHLTLADGEPEALQPESSTHSIDVTSASDGDESTHSTYEGINQAGTACRVTLADSTRLDRDVVIRWQACAHDIGVRLVEGGGLPGDDGRYGLLTLTPPAVPTTVFARDVTVLLDASGSMHGPPLELARTVVSRLLDGLRPEDHYEVLAFASSVRSLTGGVVAATPDQVASTHRQLAAVQAGGATEMASAMRAALRPMRREAQRQVVLVTDGYIGFESEIVGLAKQGVCDGARLHVVGIGAAPNRTLMAGVARAGAGIEVAAHDADSASEAAARLGQATCSPVLTDVTITGSACAGIAGAGRADVFAGRPLVAAIELAAGGGSVAVCGRLAGTDEEWTQIVRADGSRTTSLPLGAVFGRERVADVEMQLSGTWHDAESEAVLEQIETLGLRHRVATQRTSLVAVAEEPSVDPHEPRRRTRLPLEMPAGVSAEGVGYADAGLMLLGSAVGGSRMSATQIDAMPTKSILDKLVNTVRRATGRARDDLDTLSMGLPPDSRRPFKETDGGSLPDLRFRVPGVRVIRCEGSLLVLEFECPADGLPLPGPDDPIDVAAGSGSGFEARVDEAVSTSAGSYRSGQVLRLALRTVDDTPWPEGYLEITWQPSAESPECFSGGITMQVMVGDVSVEGD